MLDEKLQAEIQAVSEILGLSERTIEKDVYVTQLIHALAELTNPYYNLVFQGGTCLAKALSRLQV